MTNDGFQGLNPQKLGEAIRARKEMLNHIGQRTYNLPTKAMKAFKQAHSPSMEGCARKVWRDLIRADRAPKRALYMPGRRGAGGAA